MQRIKWWKGVAGTGWKVEAVCATSVLWCLGVLGSRVPVLSSSVVAPGTSRFGWARPNPFCAVATQIPSRVPDCPCYSTRATPALTLSCFETVESTVYGP